MKPTNQDIKTAIATLTVLRFFPAGEVAMTVLAGILSSMISTKRQLDWLVETLVNEVGEWPGQAQVRALFCTQFAPADGVDGPPCAIAGYTPADGEARYIEREAARGVKLLQSEPRRLTGEVEPPSDGDASALVNALAQALELPSTARSRLAKRRVEEAL